MWTYAVKSGKLTHNGEFEGTGYSGLGWAKNNPNCDHLPNTGPIPLGNYTIGPAHDHPELGPCVMNLDPAPGTTTYGRSAFRIHGDSREHPGAASHGCIVLGPSIRALIAKSTDRRLEVVAA